MDFFFVESKIVFKLFSSDDEPFSTAHVNDLIFKGNVTSMEFL